MNKRNSIFAEAIGNCGATFLRPDTTPLLCYRAAKEFVDEYERKEREQRHETQKREEHEMPKVGDIYRDVFGQRLVVTGIVSMDYGNRKTVVFHNKETERILPLEEFIRCFKKV